MAKITFKRFTLEHPLLFEILGATAFFLLSVAILGVAAFAFNQIVASHARAAFDEGIRMDLEYLSVEGDEVATSLALAEHLKEKDEDALRALLIHERTSRNIGLMGVTDAQGIILARTRSVDSVGENAFTQSPQGRALARGVSSVRSIEVSSFNSEQVLMTTGRPIVSEDVFLGALFSNYLLDDEYAKEFARTRLSFWGVDSEVIFYTRTHGIFGSSFLTQQDTKLFETVLDPQEQWVQSDGARMSVTLDGTEYIVENSIFKGLEENGTGAFILTPAYTAIQVVMISLLLSLSFMIVLIVGLHQHRRGYKS